jgi:hypothetical protein
MALAKKCDACEKFFDFSDDDMTPNGIALVYINQNRQIAHTIDKKELCDDCLAKINKILNKED